MPQKGDESRRHPWVGILVLLIIVLSIVAFGIFKRKGSRKPPPIPPDAISEVHGPAVAVA